ncbi:MAG: hypothetical protein ACRCYU_14270, partial [Nocardioides sp.]
MLSASELQSRGFDEIASGRFAQGRRLSLLALRRNPDPDTQAEALLQVAMVEAETSGLSHGLALCYEARALEGVSEKVRGHIHSRLGLLAMRSGDWGGAMEQFAVAEPLLQADAGALAGLLINRGYMCIQSRNLRIAVDDFRRAGDLAGNDVDRASAAHNLGYVEFLRGNYAAALRFMNDAAPVLDPTSVPRRAVNQTDRAEVLSACGLQDQAARSLEDAAQAFAEQGLRQSQAEAELARARVLQRRDPVAAGAVARKAARRFRSRGSEDWALRAEVVVL